MRLDGAVRAVVVCGAVGAGAGFVCLDADLQVIRSVSIFPTTQREGKVGENGIERRRNAKRKRAYPADQNVAFPALEHVARAARSVVADGPHGLAEIRAAALPLHRMARVAGQREVDGGWCSRRVLPAGRRAGRDVRNAERARTGDDGTKGEIVVFGQRGGHIRCGGAGGGG